MQCYSHSGKLAVRSHFQLHFLRDGCTALRLEFEHNSGVVVGWASTSDSGTLGRRAGLVTGQVVHVADPHAHQLRGNDPLSAAALFCFTLPVAASIPDEPKVDVLVPEELKVAADSRH